MREGLTFDDVLLVPQYSEVESRSKVDLSVKWGALKFEHPIIPANMLTVTGQDMAWAVVESGGLAILNRFIAPKEQIDIAEDLMEETPSRVCPSAKNHFAVSVGVQATDKEMVKNFYDVGVRLFCVDVAHGDSKNCSDMVSWIKANYNVFVIAGNVATGSGARRLWDAGANVVKVGVGPGSLCTTRIETGNGVPQLSALMDVDIARNELIALWKTRDAATDPETRTTRKFPVIADGGIKSAGDVVKALCLADMVMVGNLFAGCDEAPGNRMYGADGSYYKEYVGSSTHKTSHVEGVAAMVPYRGSYQQVLTKLLEGLRSGCSYQGASNLGELKANAEFIKITSAGLRESHPHDVIIK
jgi:IMP dehydrogenase